MQSKIKLLCVLLAVGAPVTDAFASGNESNLDVASVQQQEYLVKGTVTDASGEPLIGVSIQIKGEMDGTVTDIDGNYSISVDNSSVLVFSYVGFATQEVAVNGRGVVDVVLEQGGGSTR